jgi:hypothetical protein
MCSCDTRLIYVYRCVCVCVPCVRVFMHVRAYVCVCVCVCVAQSNRVESCLGLESCTNLEELYLSHNGIRKLEVRVACTMSPAFVYRVLRKQCGACPQTAVWSMSSDITQQVVHVCTHRVRVVRTGTLPEVQPQTAYDSRLRSSSCLHPSVSVSESLSVCVCVIQTGFEHAHEAQYP